MHVVSGGASFIDWIQYLVELGKDIMTPVLASHLKQ